MNNNEICLKTRKQLLFVQCFPLFWSPVFPCFACTVNMRLGSCCSVGENSCKSWQEVGKNTRVSLFHCFFSSPAQSFSISWMTQSLFSLHALELYFVPLPIIVHEPTIVPPFLHVPSFFTTDWFCWLPRVVSCGPRFRRSFDFLCFSAKQAMSRRKHIKDNKTFRFAKLSSKWSFLEKTLYSRGK